MYIPLFLQCSGCRQRIEVQFDSIKKKLIGICSNCKTNNSHPVDPSFHIGHALVAYASSTLKKDTNLAILFAGMAVDSYLSHLFLKWRDIAELNTQKSAYSPAAVRQKLYAELRNVRTFAEKSKRVERLIYPQGLAHFFANNKDVTALIAKGFPRIKLSDFVKNVEIELLWKRNDIAHVGGKWYSHDEALYAINYAKLFLLVFDKMDSWRRTQRI